MREKKTVRMKYGGKKPENSSWWIFIKGSVRSCFSCPSRNVFALCIHRVHVHFKEFSCFLKAIHCDSKTSTSYTPTFTSVLRVKGSNGKKKKCKCSFICILLCKCRVGTAGHICTTNINLVSCLSHFHIIIHNTYNNTVIF